MDADQPEGSPKPLRPPPEGFKSRIEELRHSQQSWLHVLLESRERAKRLAPQDPEGHLWRDVEWAFEGLRQVNEQLAQEERRAARESVGTRTGRALRRAFLRRRDAS